MPLCVSVTLVSYERARKREKERRGWEEMGDVEEGFIKEFRINSKSRFKMPLRQKRKLCFVSKGFLGVKGLLCPL